MGPNNLILRDAAKTPLLRMGSGGGIAMVEWFDDLKVGMRFTSESKTVSRDEILRFAEEFDPQPFHLDEEAAKDTILNGLAASGWHTAAIAMRLALSAKPFGPHPLFGAGVDELRWMKPVRPGDTLHLEGEVTELIPSKTRPQGIARDRAAPVGVAGNAFPGCSAALLRCAAEPGPIDEQSERGSRIRAAPLRAASRAGHGSS
jgi:acyl dehydratase